ncbi:uncharacterized protein CMU_019560 [Cryptosporidium muris RN66]|uniref:RecQ-mediated genome instability protein 1 n=1 Tax=Cryptosporidium muris (strain RN66) TaxID=441375 RepID=B6ACE3_CRYMR|nr:uncharacterized protein CMU_019560 [Cryptosporidium muris RN66]EEA06199.1 hypothetical protein, conserved [Cryptosporidium muris RN66]|eukprot:XP_002140548.1 hypothetical protein [Cryptosporidium muris RN66]
MYLLQDILRSLKLELKPKIYTDLQNNSNSVENHENGLLEILFNFNLSDTIKVGSLPTNIISWHDTFLEGVHLVQIIEAVDISCRSKDRFHYLLKSPVTTNTSESDDDSQEETKNYINKNNRMLKLLLSDGITKCVAIEYRQIPELSNFIKEYSECKYKKKNSSLDKKPVLALLYGRPIVRRGILLLVPDTIQLISLNLRDKKPSITKVETQKKQSKIASKEPSLDIRSYTKFPIIKRNEINNSEHCNEENITLKEDFENIQSLNICISSPSSISSVVELTEDNFLEVSQDKKNSDRISKITTIVKPCDSNNSPNNSPLRLWIDAAVLQATLLEDMDEVQMEIGIHDPFPLPYPWCLIYPFKVNVKKHVIEQILFTENERLDIQTEDLLTHVKFIQGYMCLQYNIDNCNKNNVGLLETCLIRLVGFSPYSGKSPLIKQILSLATMNLDRSN